MNPQRVKVDISDLWFALWPTQAALISDVHGKVATSANVGTVRCRKCGSVLAELRETRDADGHQLPLVLVAYSALIPGDTLVDADTGSSITITKGKVATDNTVGKRTSSMTAPYYAVITPGTESQPVTVSCGHHGTRGSVTAAELIAGQGGSLRR